MYRPPKNSNEQKESTPRSTHAQSTLSSGTMASLTKSKDPTKSYSNRFLEQTKIRNNPNYVPPQKPVNISSEDDFPRLGPSIAKPSSWSTSKNCIQMAEEWGKKNEEDERLHRARIIKAEEDRRRIAKEQIKEQKKEKMYVTQDISAKSKSIISGKNRFYDQYEHKFKSIDNEEEEEDSFESGPSQDEEEFYEEYNNDDEFNTDIGYERRHKDELY